MDTRLFSTCLAILVSIAFVNSETKGQTLLDVSYHRGPILKIYPSFPDNKNSYSIQTAIRWKRKGKKSWHKLYKFPETGVKLTYLSTGNSGILGSGFGLQYQIQFDKQLSPKLSFVQSIGLGGMYFDKPYDYINNPENIAIGNELSFLVDVTLKLSYSINPNWNVYTGVGFSHNSNGHTTLPNVGINIPHVLAGVQYALASKKHIDLDTARIRFKKYGAGLRVGFGWNEFGNSTAPTNGPKYPIYLLAFQGYYRFNPHQKLLLGTELYYNTGYRQYLISQEVTDLEENVENASALLLFVGHEYLYGKFGLVIQGGINLHNPFLKYWINAQDEISSSDKIKIHVPGRIGVNYYFTSPFNSKLNPYVGIHVKSNLGQADFAEITFGISY